MVPKRLTTQQKAEILQIRVSVLEEDFHRIIGYPSLHSQDKYSRLTDSDRTQW